MKKLRRWLLYIFITLLTIPMISVVAFDILWLKPRLDQINLLAAAGKTDELSPTPLIIKMVTIAEPNGFYWLVSRIIISQSQPKFEPHGNLRWHAVGFLTSHLLKLHLSESELLGIYCARTYAGSNSYGLGSISKKLFNKNLSDLTIDEAATVAVWPKAPNYFTKYPSSLEVRRDVILKKFTGGL